MIFEDEHLLVVNKPAGWNTHAPSLYAGEGIYDWLRHRESHWASLAIIHRLDKETSGVLVFGKTPLANRSLTRQFTDRRVRKRYLLLTDRPVARESWVVRKRLTRAGSRSVCVQDGDAGDAAETAFAVVARENTRTLLSAEPRTGRTHQIRVHAAGSAAPVLGDTLYSGSTFKRVCLHAQAITLEHPESGDERTFTVKADFEEDPRQTLRRALIDPAATNAFRLIHGAADAWPGWYVDRLGDYLLSQSKNELTGKQLSELERLLSQTRVRGAYHKRLSKQVRRTTPEEACPSSILGESAPERFAILENGIRFELSFREGYSVGLFLDQRDNRRRLLTHHVAGGFPALRPRSQDREWEILNTFAYTCAFSVCAAKAGATVTSLDLSRKYLGWGRRNFELNGLDPARHEFIYGDALDWMKRLRKKGRAFDSVILDPPTFSRSKESGIFRAEKDYGKLVRAAVSLLRPDGVLFASTNASGWGPEAFLETVRAAVRSQGRRIVKQQYDPQPPDFPISRDEPGYLKTAWFGIGQLDD